MKIAEMEKTQGTDSVNVLLVGNNPIELSRMLETIRKIPGKKIVTEIAFDLTTIWQRLVKFTPNFILIDDNIGLNELHETVNTLSTNPKTSHVPITVLKNSNYSGSIVTNNISDYVLKDNLTPEALYWALKNSLRFKQAREYLAKAFLKRKKQLLKLVH